MVQTSSTRINVSNYSKLFLQEKEDKDGNIWLGTTVGPIYLSKMNV